MIELKAAVQAQGFTVAHIKTDSIKIPDATPEIIEYIMEFGEMYGYTFEHEATYEKLCLVNDAVYIAKTKAGRKPSAWSATGAQFQHPFVFKTMFSKEPIVFNDMCEAKFVTTALYLDWNEPDTRTAKEKTLAAADIPMAFDPEFDAKMGPNYDPEKLRFIGKAGLFCPILPGKGGAQLLREKDEKMYAASGTKGYLWMEADMVETLNKQDDIDKSLFTNLVDAAVESISKYGDYEWFVGD